MSQTLYHSVERNAQMLVALLKAKGIRRVIASPGTTNITFVWSVQQDSFFEVFSAVDERHAAYLACGMAAESGEPVVITCTGATASRNYFPGLTEAHYRKLPILAVTAMQSLNRVGHLSPQALDRSTPPADTVIESVVCRVPQTDADAHACFLSINKALIALTRHGGGPAHINLETFYSSDFSVQELPAIKPIEYVTVTAKQWPEIPRDKRIAIWIGSHALFSKDETRAIEAFASQYNAVVIKDHTSGYYGASAVNAALLCSQGIGSNSKFANLIPEFLIHLGEVSGDYPSIRLARVSDFVWRVARDGELRDTFGKLTAIFEMAEVDFFGHYTSSSNGIGEDSDFAKSWQKATQEVREKIPELPFSNPWIASQLAPQLPAGSVLHLAILNSLRSWNLFPLPKDVVAYSNVGGFGIDGCVSTMIGASLASPQKRFFTVVGDLAFFYDLNALGNRHCGKNMRILLINNASGSEFHIYSHPAAKFGEAAGAYIAADGHYGNGSRNLVRHYVEDLGLEYRSADSKESFTEQLVWFLGDSEHSLVLECFTTPSDESDAQKLLNTIEVPPQSSRSKVTSMLPSSVKSVIKRVIQ